MIIAVIPARIGSKRIKKKNIKKFYGKPIIAWPIIAAKKSNIFDKIIVSTDSFQIALISKKYGAEVPFLRKKKLSNNKVGTSEVIVDAIENLNKLNINPTSICCIYPTAALIDSRDIVNGFKVHLKYKNQFVFTATEFASPVLRSFSYESKKVRMLFPKNYKKRSQDLKNYYHDAGQFYWNSAKAWKKLKPVYSENSKVVFVPRWRAIDIDTKDDWKTALQSAKILKLGKKY